MNNGSRVNVFLKYSNGSSQLPSLRDTAAFFSVYSILVIKTHPISEGIKTSLAIILTALAFWIMYSRTIFKCHTVQQVLMGGILGSIFGVIAFNLKNIVLQKIK